MKLKEIFKQFLKEEGVAEEYVKNWNQDFGKKPIKDPCRYLYDAFSWIEANPKDNGFFWLEIDDRWTDKLKSIGYLEV